MATEMNVEAEPAAQAQPRDYLAWWTSIETDVRKSMLVFAHREPERLHAMVRQAYEAGQQSMQAARRAAQPADVGAMPELPEPDHSLDCGMQPFYRPDQMRQYARDVIAHQAAPAQPATDFRALVQSIIEDGYLSETNMHRGRLALDGAAPAQPSAAPSALVQTLNKPSRIDAYVRQLAMSLWRTHYRETSPKFELLDDTHGVLTQIDNMITGLVLAAPTSDQQAGAVAEWGEMHTVGDMVRNLLTLDQSDPIFTAFHVTIDGERRCRTRGITISRERVIDGKWIDSSRKDVPYANIVWAKQDERAAPAAIEQAGAPIDVAAIRDIADELSLEASNYEGDFADTVNGCADALNHIVEQAGAQPVAQALPTDEQITEIARVAVGAGELNWAGYKANTDGKYTIPAISPMEFGLCRAVVRALAAPTPATDQDGAA